MEKNLPRRLFLKAAGVAPFLLSLGLPRKAQADVESEYVFDREHRNLWASPEDGFETKFPPGYLSIVQGPTSATESLINIVAPRLKKYAYEVTEQGNGRTVTVERYEMVPGPGFYNVDKIKVSGLRVGVEYVLKVKDGSTVVDERNFSALDTSKTMPTFALISCMADDYRFDKSIDPMWKRLQTENPDFVIFNGDAVYVDSFEFVERGKATEYDLWQRYTDSLKRIPFYHWQTLKPVFSTWDDHDYGTNDGDRNFVAKQAAQKLFRAIYGGQDIDGFWTQSPGGIASQFQAFGQKFFLMDDRSFRQPNKNQSQSEPYGHWGSEQHSWLLKSLQADDSPAWIINGNQFFNGQNLDFKETFEGNGSTEFKTFLQQLKTVNAPVVFGSGDVHISEIMEIPAARFGYTTYEFTSSSMHSYLGDGWENPMRLDGAYCKEFNFLLVRAQAATGKLQVDVKCVGIPSQPFFQKSLTISRDQQAD